MIDKEKINIDWINQVAKTNRNADRILVEKVIRALLLLEGLVIHGLPFVFKGGTSLMLHFNSSKRLSIDIDIIISEKIEDLEAVLNSVAKQQGFNNVELQKRAKHSNIEKAHYKFYYTPAHKTAKEEEYILLDILFEEIAYKEIIQIPIKSKFTPLIGDDVLVNVPCLEDLLGDKLTAFAPNTTGIPYFKGEDSMSMEIIKQLYDIGNLFDTCNNLEVIRETFKKFAVTELLYRNANEKTEKDVIEDIFQTSLCITSRGAMGNANIEELQLGIKRIAGFIFSETYHIEKAITHATKAAYISTLIETDIKEIEKFENPQQIKDWSITNQDYNKLNKLKKSNPEAFFYWYKIVELINDIENGKK